MKGALLIYALFVFICLAGVIRPHIGLIGYFGFAILCPEWNWRWSLNLELGFQKFIAASTLIGFVLHGLRGNKLSGATLWAVVGLGGFLVLAVLSMQTSIAPQQSSFYMSVMWKIVLMVPVGIILLDTPEKIRAMMWVTVLASGYNVFQINLEYLQLGYSRALDSGWGYVDNNSYSLVTLALIPLSASLAYFSTKTWQQVIAGLILLMQIHVIMMLLSRSCMLGGFLSLFVWLLLVRKSFKLVFGIAVLGLLSFVLLGDYVIEEFASSFASEGELDASASQRYELWEAGWAITLENPALGVGPDAARYITPRYMNTDRPTRALHNLFFELSTGMGLPATALYISFYGLIFLSALRLLITRRKVLPDWCQACCMTVIAVVPGYWLASMFVSGSLLEAPYVATMIGGAALLVQARANQEATVKSFQTPDILPNNSLPGVMVPQPRPV